MLIVMVVLGQWIFAGINPLQLLDAVPHGTSGGTYAESTMPTGGGAGPVAASDETRRFVATVLAETEAA